jgi:hypothetical protein
MKRIKLVMLAAILLVITAEQILAIGLGGSAPYWGSGPMENYCLGHGGNPMNGNCYFPDGSYCDLRSFYNGTCPGREYYEQNMWMAETYSFLYGDVGYYSPYYAPNRGVGTPYYGYNYNYWPTYSNYGPFYTQGYGWI